MKKITIFCYLIILLLCSNVCHADNWIQKTDFPATQRMYPVCFAIGTKGYLGTGSNANFSTRYNDLWEYDPVTNSWSQKASLPTTEARVGAVAFTVGTKAYIGTGYGTQNVATDFWEWDQTTNVWTKKAAFPGSPRYDAAAFSIGNKGYIGTGTNGSSDFSDFWEYDATTNLWAQKSDFGGGIRYGATSCSIGKKGYIGVGTSANFTSTYQDFWEWDQLTDTWMQKSDFAGSPRYYGVGFAIGTNVYIGTGIDNSGLATKDFWMWDAVTDTWVQKSDFGGGTRALMGGSGSFVIGSNAYIGTGLGSQNSLHKDLWEYQSDRTTTVGKSNSFNEQFQIFPNPAKKTFNIVLPNNFTNMNDLTLVIYDMMGKEVKVYSMEELNNGNIELPRICSGVYKYLVKQGMKSVANGRMIITE